MLEELQKPFREARRSQRRRGLAARHNGSRSGYTGRDRRVAPCPRRVSQDDPPTASRGTTMLNVQQTDDLDPRRHPRGVRRDWKSMSRVVSVARLHELLASVLVRLGVVR